MKSNKVPGPDSIPIEFNKALFFFFSFFFFFFFFFFFSVKQRIGRKKDSMMQIKYLEIIFNKIWEGSFPDDRNSTSIMSILRKGDLSNCNNY